MSAWTRAAGGGERREAQVQRCLCMSGRDIDQSGYMGLHSEEGPEMNLGVVSRGTARKATTLDEPATGGSAVAEAGPGALEVKVQGGDRAAAEIREPAWRQEESRRFQGEGGPRCHRLSWVRDRPRVPEHRPRG